MTDIELCRVMLPAPMAAVGIVGKIIGSAFPTARATMRGDHMAIVIDRDEFDDAYEALAPADEDDA